MAEVLEILVKASERAASVARSCTGSNRDTLLVAEKCGGDGNARFDQDFKTLADVLAQESAKVEIASRFPGLAKDVRGEECAEIGGVNIKICDSVTETKELLCCLVPFETAHLMAEAAHKNISVSLDLPADLPSLDPNDLGVWIDPIDATAEFIAGVKGTSGADSGLPCVTVLIGAYDKTTGEPVIGVINQPFFDNGKGRIIWGISYNNIKYHGGGNTQTDNGGKLILISGAERSELKTKLESTGWSTKSYPGAGNKLMKVVLGEADAYVVSQGTTFRWDTCAPHAILRAEGGDILSFDTYSPLTYNDPHFEDVQQFCNKGGIIAFRHYSIFQEIKELLK